MDSMGSLVTSILKKLKVRHVNAEGGDDKVTALHIAAAGGHVSLARLLLGKGAYISARDSNGTTPLHHAAGNSRAKMVQILIESGADVTIADEQGRVARDVATAENSLSASVRKHIDNAADLRAAALERRRAARKRMLQTDKEL